jgi:hypothetical protein
MKTTKYFLAALLILTTVLSAQGIKLSDPVVKAKYATIEKNLLHGLNSDNEGLRISCAYYLGEIKSGKAVNQLMALLRNDCCYGARIVAALSLIKIDDPQGVYMVKRTAQFNSNENVRKMSEKFYLSYFWQKYIEENPEKAVELSYVKF